ncbi:MAG TPA: lytic murein transglycosylase B, partial [Gammaproteobacteria bacterium]|nr:lytic murein transglycosylase B [Gammaproteobacteria bacterium]
LLLLAACAHRPTLPGTTPVTPTGNYASRPDVQQFMAEVQKKDGFDPAWLERAFQGAQKHQSIIDAITRPYESKPWYQYRSIFVNENRISAGAAFWDQHAQLLAAAEARYGVDADIIVAIIGVESLFGKQHGGYPVIDALSTLSFDYPPRAPFFQGELEQFLVLCREQNFDPLKPMGSYAGAMGAPQFMPDSFRTYAVDFDGDGKRDIWEDWPDIIGSVANYFHMHGWQENGLTVVPAALPMDAVAPAPVVTTVGALRRTGVSLSEGLDDASEAVLISLQDQDRMEYWVGLHNFRVITQYNKSPLYAMAVIQLANAISQRRAAEGHDAPP